MIEAEIVRHSISAYPKDALTVGGVIYARSFRKQFSGYSRAVTSARKRTQQTVQALGYSRYQINSNFNELEISEISAATAHEYVMEAHRQYPSFIASTSQMLLEGLVQVADEDSGRVLIVSHNLALSALLYALTGSIESFNYLEGISIQVLSGSVSFVGRV